VALSANQLEAAKEWQLEVNQLPDGRTLFVLPAGSGHLEMESRHLRFTLYYQKRGITVTRHLFVDIGTPHRRLSLCAAMTLR
jgi:hypothetical protein